MAIINGYQTLNPNRENNRVMLPSIVTVHWTKQPSSMTEHHAMVGASNIKLSKGVSGGASASATSASASVSTAASTVTAASRGTTFTVRNKLSLY